MKKALPILSLILSLFAVGIIFAPIAEGQSSIWEIANKKYVRKDRTRVVADTTADNIVAASATTNKVPLNVQQYTAAGVDAFKVHANGSYRLRIDSNGTAFIQGAQAWKYDAITPAASTGTAIPTARYMVIVADAATASRHIQLPAANSIGAGHAILVIDGPATAATGNITVNRAGADTITTTTTGNTTATITTNGGAALFISDGTSVWKRILLAG